MSRYQLQRHSLTPPFMSGLAREVDQLQDSIQRMFESPFTLSSSGVPFEPLGWVPAAEITETKGEILMTVELPGLDRNDVHIEVERGVLTLRGEKRTERVQEEKEKEYFLEERRYGSFQRSFTLPPSVDAEKITASFEKGVLSIRLPKTETEKPRGREINIEVK